MTSDDDLIMCAAIAAQVKAKELDEENWAVKLGKQRAIFYLKMAFLIFSATLFLGIFLAYCLQTAPSEAIWGRPLWISFYATMLAIGWSER